MRKIKIAIYIGTLIYSLFWKYATCKYAKFIKEDCNTSEENEEYRLEKTIPLQFECIGYILTIASLMIFTPLTILGITGVFLLGLCAVSDIAKQTINELLIVAVFIIAVTIGGRTNKIGAIILAAIIIIGFDVLLGESDRFGSADVFLLAGGLACFGLCSWPIFLLVSSVLGILLKIIRWALRKDNLEEHMVTFVPPIFAGTLATIYIDSAFGHLYKFTIADLLQLFF